MSEDPWYLKNYKDMLRSKGRLLPLVEMEMVKEAQAKNSKRDTDHLHPSELSKKDWCGRAAYYKITGAEAAPDNYTSTRLNVFAEGNNIHAKWQKWLWKAGVLSGLWHCDACSYTWYDTSPNLCTSCNSDRLGYREVPVRDDEHRIIGHADGEILDREGRALIEIKSVGIGTVRFEKPSLYADYADGTLNIESVWKNIKSPFASHVRQGHIYMHCRKIDTMIFIYEWKPTQAIKEFVIKYNPDIINPILDNCKKIISHLESSTEPERPEWAVNKSCSGCKYCPYKKVCWS
jgi:rubrerythrin